MANLSPSQQRVVEEKVDLDARMHKLGAFIRSPASLEIDPQERKWMVSQWYAMHAYSRALAGRIETYS